LARFRAVNHRLIRVCVATFGTVFFFFSAALARFSSWLPTQIPTVSDIYSEVGFS
jgi:hypothetical protein